MKSLNHIAPDDEVSLNIYIRKEEVQRFHVWAGLQKVKVKQLGELRTLNAVGPSDIKHLLMTMGGKFSSILHLVKAIYSVGKKIVAISLDDKKFDVKTERQVKKAISFKAD